MITYKIGFMIESSPAKPDDESTVMNITARMPYVPRVGDMVAARDADDLREVERVYWTPRDGLVVWFKYDINAKEALLKRRGWKRAQP